MDSFDEDEFSRILEDYENDRNNSSSYGGVRSLLSGSKPPSRVNSLVRMIETKSLPKNYETKRRDSSDFDDMFKDIQLEDDINAEFDKVFHDDRPTSTPNRTYHVNPRVDVVHATLRKKVRTLNNSALNNLEEINDLQKNLKLAKQELAKEQVNRLNLEQRAKLLKEKIHETNNLIAEKDKEISGAVALNRQVRIPQVDHNDLLKHEIALRAKIQDFGLEYERTRRVTGIPAILNETRELFDLFVAQLNEYNSQNISVANTLEALFNLDVRIILYFNQTSSNHHLFETLHLRQAFDS